MKPPFTVHLRDKTIVITGGAGVLCSGFAHLVAALGAKVALLDLKADDVNRVAANIVEAGGQALAVATNVLDRDSLKLAHAQIAEQFGPTDILINGAGGNHPKGTTSRETIAINDLDDPSLTSFFDLDGEAIKYVFDLNFLGTLLPTQIFAKDMLGRDGCSIVNISSMNAFRPLTKIPAYSAAKAAVSNFTQWLAVHFSSLGIRVNAIAPGFFVTNQNQKLLFEADGRPSARAHKILTHTPMARFGEPQDLAGTLLWLISPAASGFVTGVVIPVDGGFAAYSGV